MWVNLLIDHPCREIPVYVGRHFAPKVKLNSAVWAVLSGFLPRVQYEKGEEGSLTMEDPKNTTQLGG